MNVMQILLDSGINVFGLKLLIESYNTLKPEIFEIMPNPLVINIDGVEITLTKKAD